MIVVHLSLAQVAAVLIGLPLAGGLVARWRDVLAFLHEVSQPTPDPATCTHVPDGDGYCTECGIKLDPLPYVRRTLDAVHDPHWGEVDVPEDFQMFDRDFGEGWVARQEWP